MRVFITGGTTGIGFELAKLYLKSGYEVCVSGRDLSKISPEYKNQLRGFQFDVRDEVSFKQAIDSAGPIDLMIANAGISVGNKTDLPDFQVGKEVIETNILGLHYAISSVLPQMLDRKSGHIVALGSVAGMVGLPGASFYSGSKAYVLKFMESLALTLPKRGISVTAIAPGFIDTPLTRKNPHSMPFKLSVEEGARRIKKAIDEKKVLYSFPLPMFMIVFVLERLPRFLYRKLFNSKLFDYRRSHDS